MSPRFALLAFAQHLIILDPNIGKLCDCNNMLEDGILLETVCWGINAIGDAKMGCIEWKEGFWIMRFGLEFLWKGIKIYEGSMYWQKKDLDVALGSQD